MTIPKTNMAEEEPLPALHLNERYPDPAGEVLDPSFAKYRIFNAAVERLARGMRWAEGPVWFGGGRYLLWSDLPNNRSMKWEVETGYVIVFRKPSNYVNGNTKTGKVGSSHTSTALGGSRGLNMTAALP
jgi:sugar lactone lactonase YvrE